MIDITVGDNIKLQRIKKGLTQKELSLMLGTTQQNIAQYESNKRNPKEKTIIKIAEALGVDVSVLYEDVEIQGGIIRNGGWYPRPQWEPTTQEERDWLEKESDRVLLQKIKSLPDIQQAALNVIIEGLFNNQKKDPEQ